MNRAFPQSAPISTGLSLMPKGDQSALHIKVGQRLLGKGLLTLLWLAWFRLPIDNAKSASVALRLLVPVGLLNGLQAAPQVTMATSLVP